MSISDLLLALSSRFETRPNDARPQARRRDPERPLIFSHVPKTSGSTLRMALAAALAPRRIAAGFDMSFFADFAALETLSADIRQTIFHGPDELPRGADLVLAHMAYTTTAAAYPLGQHLIVLREPSTRLMSHYLYWRALPDSEIARWGDWGDRVLLARGDLADFLSNANIACQTDNIVVRMLLWPHPAIPAAGFISPAVDAALIAAAKARLLHYDYVDAIERPGFASALGDWLGHPLAYDKINVTDTMPDELRTGLCELLTPQAMSHMRMRTRLDDVIWRLVVGTAGDSEALRLGTLLPAIARYGTLMAPLPARSAAAE